MTMPHGELEVFVEGAIGIKDPSLLGKGNPYCTLRCGTQVSNTPVVEGGGSYPFFNTKFHLNVDSTTSALHIALYSKGNLWDDELVGYTTLNFKDIFYHGHTVPVTAYNLVRRSGNPGWQRRPKNPPSCLQQEVDIALVRQSHERRGQTAGRDQPFRAHFAYAPVRQVLDPPHPAQWGAGGQYPQQQARRQSLPNVNHNNYEENGYRYESSESGSSGSRRRTQSLTTTNMHGRTPSEHEYVDDDGYVNSAEQAPQYRPTLEGDTYPPNNLQQRPASRSSTITYEEDFEEEEEPFEVSGSDSDGYDKTTPTYIQGRPNHPLQHTGSHPSHLARPVPRRAPDGLRSPYKQALQPRQAIPLRPHAGIPLRPRQAINGWPQHQVTQRRPQVEYQAQQPQQILATGVVNQQGQLYHQPRQQSVGGQEQMSAAGQVAVKLAGQVLNGAARGIVGGLFGS